jgi:hypothetical protein
MKTASPKQRVILDAANGCERQSQSFVEGCHTMPVRRA